MFPKRWRYFATVNSVELIKEQRKNRKESY